MCGVCVVDERREHRGKAGAERGHGEAPSAGERSRQPGERRVCTGLPEVDGAQRHDQRRELEHDQRRAHGALAQVLEERGLRCGGEPGDSHERTGQRSDAERAEQRAHEVGAVAPDGDGDRDRLDAEHRERDAVVEEQPVDDHALVRDARAGEDEARHRGMAGQAEAEPRDRAPRRRGREHEQERPADQELECRDLHRRRLGQRRGWFTDSE